MKNKYFIKLTILIFLAVSVLAETSSKDLSKAFALISERKIKAYLKYLSSDELEGRGTGQKGGKLAANYIAAQFKDFGLKKVASINSYFQEVPLIGIKTKSDSYMEIGDIKFKWLEDYVMSDEIGDKEFDLEAEMVYVGYGITAPEYGWDDYKNIDVKDKVLLVLVNEPVSSDENFFEGRALTYYGRWTYKFEHAAEKGALGVILIHTDKGAGYGWNVVKNSWGREQFYFHKQKDEKRLHLASWITNAKAMEVFKRCGLNYEDLVEKASRRDFIPIKMCSKVKARLRNDVREITTANVVGYIQGMDEKLSREAIILTSHYDHLGKGKAVRGDSIYNGAVDNASGVSVSLELARIFTQSGIKFKRSIVFIATAAEEDGLRGSEYYVKHPLFPLEDTVININIDSVSVWGPTDAITFLGIDKTNLMKLGEEVAKIMNVKLIPETKPELGMFFRSDQFNFMRANIAGIYVKQGGNLIGKNKQWGEKKLAEYISIKYHTPFDEYDDNWDLEGAVQMVKVVAVTISLIDDMEEPVKLLKKWDSTK